MKPDQVKIERLRREVAKLKAEREIFKSRRLLCEGVDVKFRLHRKDEGCGRQAQ
jgi:hypothetical protein